MCSPTISIIIDKLWFSSPTVLNSVLMKNSDLKYFHLVLVICTIFQVLKILNKFAVKNRLHQKRLHVRYERKTQFIIRVHHKRVKMRMRNITNIRLILKTNKKEEKKRKKHIKVYRMDT